jgi:hypothetical protein
MLKGFKERKEIQGVIGGHTYPDRGSGLLAGARFIIKNREVIQRMGVSRQIALDAGRGAMNRRLRGGSVDDIRDSYRRGGMLGGRRRRETLGLCNL